VRATTTGMLRMSEAKHAASGGNESGRDANDINWRGGCFGPAGKTFADDDDVTVWLVGEKLKSTA
jgi:hypothetical protein